MKTSTAIIMALIIGICIIIAADNIGDAIIEAGARLGSSISAKRI